MEIEIEKRVIFKPHNDISTSFAERGSSKTSIFKVEELNGLDTYKRICLNKQGFGHKQGLGAPGQIVSQVKRGVEEVCLGCTLSLEYDVTEASEEELEFFAKDNFTLDTSTILLSKLYPNKHFSRLDSLAYYQKAEVDRVILPESSGQVYIIEVEYSSISEALHESNQLWHDLENFGEILRVRNFTKSKLSPLHPNYEHTLKTLKEFYKW